MSTQTEVQKRIDRARREAIEFSVASTDPLVVMADNEDGTGSGSTPYTVVPQALHCGCPDDTFRGPVCKHLLALALTEDWRGATVREAIGREFKQLTDELTDLEERYEAVQERHEALEAVRAELGRETEPQPTDPDLVPTDEELDATAAEGVELLDAMAEDEPDSSDDDVGQLARELTGQ